MDTPGNLNQYLKQISGFPFRSSGITGTQLKKEDTNYDDPEAVADPAFVKEIATETAGIDVYVDEGIGIVVSEEVRQYGDYGYSILDHQKVNVFLTPTD